jgi:hypothetical protein
MYLADRIGFHIAAATMSLFQIQPLEGKTAPTPETATYMGDLIRQVFSILCQPPHASYFFRDVYSDPLFKFIASRVILTANSYLGAETPPISYRPLR